MSFKSNPKMGVFSIALMSVAGVFTLRTLPLMAKYGLSAVFYYVAAAIIFFIPSALICAELATGWAKTGGIYVWIREAFGPRLGFLAIWLEWINTVISFPATLAFIVGTFVYAFNPALADNKYFMLIFMLVIFWGATGINFLGIRISSMISNIALIFGTILPCLLIIGLSVGWLVLGHPAQIHFTFHDFLPNFKLANSAFLVGLLLGYAGMQIAAFHAQETKNPQKDYPRAIFYATALILCFSIFGSLAIALVIPPEKISLVSGLIQAAQVFFVQFHMQWFIPLMAIFTAMGTLAGLNQWLIGPCKGLLAAAFYGDLPKSMQKVNPRGAPTTLLLIQACVGTLFSLVYLLMPSVNTSFWILVDLSAMLTLLMYMLMFASAIRLRHSQPHVFRSYRIPGGKTVMWFVGGVGMITCLVAFCFGFIPPEQLHMTNLLKYEVFLIVGLVVVCLVPFFLPRKKHSNQ